MAHFPGTFKTGRLAGSKPKPSAHALLVPYKDTVLKGQALLQQLEKCVGGMPPPLSEPPLFPPPLGLARTTAGWPAACLVVPCVRAGRLLAMRCRL